MQPKNKSGGVIYGVPLRLALATLNRDIINFRSVGRSKNMWDGRRVEIQNPKSRQNRSPIFLYVVLMQFNVMEKSCTGVFFRAWPSKSFLPKKVSPQKDIFTGLKSFFHIVLLHY